MAVTETREVLIEPTPDEIMDVLVDLESLTEWLPAHQEAELLEWDEQDRPSGRPGQRTSQPGGWEWLLG